MRLPRGPATRQAHSPRCRMHCHGWTARLANARLANARLANALLTASCHSSSRHVSCPISARDLHTSISFPSLNSVTWPAQGDPQPRLPPSLFPQASAPLFFPGLFLTTHAPLVTFPPALTPVAFCVFHTHHTAPALLFTPCCPHSVARLSPHRVRCSAYVTSHKCWCGKHAATFRSTEMVVPVMFAGQARKASRAIRSASGAYICQSWGLWAPPAAGSYEPFFSSAQSAAQAPSWLRRGRCASSFHRRAQGIIVTPSAAAACRRR